MTLYEQLSERYKTASEVISLIDGCNEFLKKHEDAYKKISMISLREKLLAVRIDIMKLHEEILTNEI